MFSWERASVRERDRFLNLGRFDERFFDRYYIATIPKSRFEFLDSFLIFLFAEFLERIPCIVNVHSLHYPISEYIYVLKTHVYYKLSSWRSSPSWKKWHCASTCAILIADTIDLSVSSPEGGKATAAVKAMMFCA